MSVNIPFVLYFCIVTSVFIYYWRNTCETSASRGGRPWNRLWVCPQVPKCLHYFVIVEAGVENSADIWGILYIWKENGDWPRVLRACWENFQTTWLLGRVLLLPFPGGFLIPQLLAQSPSCAQKRRFLRTTCIVIWFSRKVLSTLSPLPPKQLFPLSQGGET